MTEPLPGPASSDRDGSDIASRGLYLDPPAWSYHVFDITTSPRSRSRGRTRRAQAMLRALCFGLGAMLVAGSAGAQVSLTPRTIQLEALTCRTLLALSGEQRDRLLIYLNGYFDGRRGASIWDERQTGERIDRALAECKPEPDALVLRIFADVWSR